MTPEILAHNVSMTGSLFFYQNTMDFFGDTMKNYGVKEVEILTRNGTQQVYELYRKKPVKMGLENSAFFDIETYKRVFPVC